MTKTKAKIKFCKFEGAIAMQLLYMDSRFDFGYSSDPSEPYFTADNGMLIARDDEKFSVLQNDFILLDDLSVMAPAHPEVNVNHYILGEEADALIIKSFDALVDWAKNYQEWSHEDPIKPTIKEYEGGVVYVEV